MSERSDINTMNNFESAFEYYKTNCSDENLARVDIQDLNDGDKGLFLKFVAIDQSSSPNQEEAKALAVEIMALHEKLPKIHNSEDLMKKIRQLQKAGKIGEIVELTAKMGQEGNSRGDFYAYLRNKIKIKK
ncbi:MAG: hypothetical protein ABIJ91_01245 [Candidatus Kuenenbacteria bacterium]